MTALCMKKGMDLTVIKIEWQDLVHCVGEKGRRSAWLPVSGLDDWVDQERMQRRIK